MARKKNWVNPNPTECNHAGCQIAAKSKADKTRALKAPTPVKTYTSKVKPQGIRYD